MDKKLLWGDKGSKLGVGEKRIGSIRKGGREREIICKGKEVS